MYSPANWSTGGGEVPPPPPAWLLAGLDSDDSVPRDTASPEPPQYIDPAAAAHVASLLPPSPPPPPESPYAPPNPFGGAPNPYGSAYAPPLPTDNSSVDSIDVDDLRPAHSLQAEPQIPISGLPDPTNFPTPGADPAAYSGPDIYDRPTYEEVDSRAFRGGAPPPPPAVAPPPPPPEVPPYDTATPLMPGEYAGFHNAPPPPPATIKIGSGYDEEPVLLRPGRLNDADLPASPLLSTPSLSDPGYQQPSVRSLAADPATGAGERAFAATNLITEPDSLSQLLAAEAEKKKRALTRDDIHTGGLAGRLGPSDASLLGWRVAGIAWLVLIASFTIPFFQADALQAAVVFFAPLLAFAGLLLIGLRVAGLLAMAIAAVYGVMMAAIGWLIMSQSPLLANFGDIATLPPTVHGPAFIALGMLIVFSGVLLLVGEPGRLRAGLGGLAVILPAIIAAGLFLTADVKPRLRNPQDTYAARTFRADQAGITFVKPQGWTTYPWDDIVTISRLGAGLKTPPDMWFVDRSQTLLFAIYTTDPPRRTWAGLLGAAPLSELEMEITRGFAALPEQPEPFRFRDRSTVTTRHYEGTTPAGAQLTITIDRHELRDRVLLLVMTRDRASATSRDTADTELNRFYEKLEFIR